MGYYELGIFFLGFVTAFAVIGSVRNIAIGVSVFLILMFILRHLGLTNL